MTMKKRFITLNEGVNLGKTFSSSLTLLKNKLKHLLLENLNSLILCLWVKRGKYNVFASKARANQREESYGPVRFSIWVGSDLACKH